MTLSPLTFLYIHVPQFDRSSFAILISSHLNLGTARFPVHSKSRIYRESSRYARGGISNVTGVRVISWRLGRRTRRSRRRARWARIAARIIIPRRGAGICLWHGSRVTVLRSLERAELPPECQTPQTGRPPDTNERRHTSGIGLSCTNPPDSIFGFSRGKFGVKGTAEI